MMMLAGSSSEKHQIRLASAESDFKTATDDLDLAGKLLQKTREMEIKRFAKILESVKDMEGYRVNHIKSIIEVFLQLAT